LSASFMALAMASTAVACPSFLFAFHFWTAL
jgi:hypothetical protein